MAAAPLDEGACLKLRDALACFVGEVPIDVHCSTAYWALGKLRDQSLLPLFRAGLAYHAERGTSSVYQILIALQDVGEPVPWERCSAGYDDPDNIRVARAYLSRVSR